MTAQTDGVGAGATPRGGTIRNPGDEAAPGAPQTGETACPECGGEVKKLLSAPAVHGGSSKRQELAPCGIPAGPASMP